jgi:MFS family permease
MSQELASSADREPRGGGVRAPRYAWVILLVVFLASVAAPLNQAKVPPLMPVLRETFALDLGQAGLLMSVFSLTGLILALPAGLIMQRLGPKATGLIALGCLVVGAAMGALSPTAGLLLASRVIEGVGMGLITVIAPAIIALWFPREVQGTPMGIWATWVPVGNVTMFNLAPLLGTAFGWQSVWWLGAGFALFTLVLFGWLMRMPTGDEAASDAPHGADDVMPATLGSALRNPHIWLLALSFGSFNVVFIAFPTFFPTYLSEAYSYSLPQAAFITSLTTLVVLGSAPLGGWLSDRIGSRKWLIVIPSAIVAVMFLLPFRIAGWQLYVFTILLGLIAGPVPTASFAAVPEVMERPQMTGFGMAVLAVGQNLGMVIGPVMFGAIVERAGWLVAGYWLIPFCLLALVAALLARMR